jgi:hypothetical protein
MYTLRNQVTHGGATWNSSAKCTQICDSVTFLPQLVSFVIDIMIDNSNQIWGSANYPVAND